MKINKDFKTRLSYDWFFYLAVVIVSVFVWIFTFNIYHAPKNYESITLFYAGTINDYKFQNEAKKAINMKNVEISSSNPSDVSFYSKYQSIGLNGCDVVFIPDSIAEKTSCKGVFKELTESYNLNFYTQENINYGLTISDDIKEKLKVYFNFTTENYSLFVSDASVNSGSITNKNFDLIKWMIAL